MNMRKLGVKRIIMGVVVLSMSLLLLAGCESSDDGSGDASDSTSSTSAGSDASADTDVAAPTVADTLNVTFGEGGETFPMTMEDNVTADKIASDVGTTSWNLPIYDFDNFENWEVMQYYEISSSYEYESTPEHITSEKAGEVYYSDPNRIVLFYQDANVEGDYTLIGRIENTDGLAKAVEENPVLEGWGNKIVSISPAE